MFRNDLAKKIGENRRKVIFILNSAGFLTLINLFMPQKVYAEGGGITDIRSWILELDIAKGTEEGNLVETVVGVLNFVIGLVGLMSIIFLIYGGILFITAGGDETKIEKATKTISQSIIGLVIVILSGIIVNFVINRIVEEVTNA